MLSFMVVRRQNDARKESLSVQIHGLHCGDSSEACQMINEGLDCFVYIISRISPGSYRLGCAGYRESKPGSFAFRTSSLAYTKTHR